jgi:hypothetical protein
MTATVSAGLAGALVLVGFVVYFIPTALGIRRKIRNPVDLFIVNLIVGWTVIGWVLALLMALRDPVKDEPLRSVPPVTPTSQSLATYVPGWYPDPWPSSIAVLRWWDGYQWTPHTQPWPAA